MTHSLPISIYATPGVRAFGDAGRVPATDDECAGLQIAYVAHTAAMEKVTSPSFGFLTSQERAAGGGKASRAPFLLLAVLHVEARPDILMVVGVWLLDKDDLHVHYPFAKILRADP